MGWRKEETFYTSRCDTILRRVKEQQDALGQDEKTKRDWVGLDTESLTKVIGNDSTYGIRMSVYGLKCRWWPRRRIFDKFLKLFHICIFLFSQTSRDNKNIVFILLMFLLNKKNKNIFRLQCIHVSSNYSTIITIFYKLLCSLWTHMMFNILHHNNEYYLKIKQIHNQSVKKYSQECN